MKVEWKLDTRDKESGYEWHRAHVGAFSLDVERYGDKDYLWTMSHTGSLSECRCASTLAHAKRAATRALQRLIEDVRAVDKEQEAQ